MWLKRDEELKHYKIFIPAFLFNSDYLNILGGGGGMRYHICLRKKAKTHKLMG
jgi:hypothetical protein